MFTGLFREMWIKFPFLRLKWKGTCSDSASYSREQRKKASVGTRPTPGRMAKFRNRFFPEAKPPSYYFFII
jgi:hypothetical protein